jgi:hypothetical protein
MNPITKSNLFWSGLYVNLVSRCKILSKSVSTKVHYSIVARPPSPQGEGTRMRLKKSHRESKVQESDTTKDAMKTKARPTKKT